MDIYFNDELRPEDKYFQQEPGDRENRGRKVNGYSRVTSSQKFTTCNGKFPSEPCSCRGSYDALTFHTLKPVINIPL